MLLCGSVQRTAADVTVESVRVWASYRTPGRRGLGSGFWSAWSKMTSLTLTEGRAVFLVSYFYSLILQQCFLTSILLSYRASFVLVGMLLSFTVLHFYYACRDLSLSSSAGFSDCDIMPCSAWRSWGGRQRGGHTEGRGHVNKQRNVFPNRPTTRRNTS